MSIIEELRAGLVSVGAIVGLLAFVCGLETLIPLVRRSGRRLPRLRSNLVLSAFTLGLNLVAGAILVVVLQAEQARGLGIGAWLGLTGWAELSASLVVLDLSFYVAHVAMHALPFFWRFHAVHHADPLVDATTTLRQHPGEFVIRTVFTAAFAVAFGVQPASYAVYRSAVALFGLLEHANVRIPRRLDLALSLITTWPGFHKVHHAREPERTNSNYANLFSIWDRLFGTLTADFRDREFRYGLEGLTDDEAQTLPRLLALPRRLARRATRPLPPRAERGCLAVRE